MNPADPVTRTFMLHPARLAPIGRNSHRGSASLDPNVRKARSFSESDGAGDAPDVDHLTVLEVEVLVGSMRGRDDEKLGLFQDAVERHERLVMDVRVGAQHPRAFERGELSQLVAERGARVVRLALE